jgi:hypothetical protein
VSRSCGQGISRASPALTRVSEIRLLRKPKYKSAVARRNPGHFFMVSF